MSYDLAVWEGERPATDDAGATVHDELYERFIGSAETMPPSVRIERYVSALLERYPDIDVAEESPWSTSPLMGEASGPYVYFPMVYSTCREASAWCAGVAAEHGLVCFDPQLGILRP
ncbi:hypothetical protein R8Z50_30220 [Longispora sp. K20-0274]|uniref:hypothetical protein n=1 Tax=Longispora sp. K20-0274 TaxID=3088255 RepID=UPI00399B1427